MVGDNLWLGRGVIVCPGVGIGENTVLGAGAVDSGPARQGCRRWQPGPGHVLVVTAGHRGTIRGRDPIQE
jgi:acetyltransferase-like isoleucine patch superfamily enzyme